MNKTDRVMFSVDAGCMATGTIDESALRAKHYVNFKSGVYGENHGYSVRVFQPSPQNTNWNVTSLSTGTMKQVCVASEH